MSLRSLFAFPPSLRLLGEESAQALDVASPSFGVAARLTRALGADHAHGAMTWALDHDFFQLGFHELAANLR